MDKLRLKEQVEIIRQAFGYIDRFKNQTFVVKLEGSLVSHPFFPILVKDIVLLHRMGIRIVLVPGAKQRIDEVLETYKIICRTVNGIRISPADSMPLIKMAAFDVCNKIMTLLAESNTTASMGNWVKAHAIGVRDGVDYESTGTVEKVQTDVINTMLGDGLIPIFPNIGWSAKGKPYNISSNELAFAIAAELKAAKLFFITDFGGVPSKKFKIPPAVYVSSDGIISQMTMEEAGSFLDLNAKVKSGPSFDLVSLAYRACKAGVARVHIVDGRVEGLVLKEIFSNRGFGTMIYANQHENIRPLTLADIPEVIGVMEPLVEDQALIPRTTADIEKRLDDYIVYEVDGTIHGCGALHPYPNKSGEIAGIVVDEMYANLGTGRKILQYLIEKASKLKLKTAFVLTTQTEDWFTQFGFTKGTLNDLPAEKASAYNAKRGSKVLLYKLSKHRTARHLLVA
jgi:amino-acid N-acetyltransferase